MTARRRTPLAESTVCEATPTAVVSFPTAMPPEQRRQDTARRRHCEGPGTFKARLPGLVAHLHGLGVRPTTEFLLELIGPDEDVQINGLLLLERYGRLDRGVVEAVGGNTFPPVVFSVGST